MKRKTTFILTALLVAPVLESRAAVVLTTLHSFHVTTNGAAPQAALVLGGDGYFYGTTAAGGTNGGYGTVFKISTNGALTSLHSFSGGTDGSQPEGLVQGSDGNFYGATAPFFYVNGTVFKISANGALTTLHFFTGGSDGGHPNGGLVEGADGYFYGTTAGGGSNAGNNGTVFKISATGALTTLYSFTGTNDGRGPNGGLVEGTDGYFYGTTGGGGTNGGNGTVFKISANGALTSLHSFTGGSDAATHQAALVLGGDGYFYGTTAGGGTNGGNGTVFKISTNGALTSLHSFSGGTDGSQPEGLVQGSDGNFYGTTDSGGTSYGWGTVFKISATGALTTLYSFTGTNDGGGPVAGLAQGSDSYFYGTTEGGGTNGGNGTVFKISAKGALTTLYSFPAPNNDGANPSAGLAQGADGNFYGTAGSTVFKMTAAGRLTSLYFFTGDNDGGGSKAGLVQGSDGNFYGETSSTIFTITTNGALTTLYSFPADTNVGYATAGLALGSDGNFYGTTAIFDPWDAFYASGTVFKISPNGSLTTLHSFTGGNDGAVPRAEPTQGNDGNLYGTAFFGGPYTNQDNLNLGAGTVFKISPNGSLTTLYSFTGGNDGANPRAALVLGSDGHFYGTTIEGGAYGGGTVFEITTSGVLTTLYAFGSVTDTNGNPLDGSAPNTLVQGNDGFFYGTTDSESAYSAIPYQHELSGTVFKISTNGSLTTLYSFTGFTGGNDGATPVALMQGSDGSFYGTTLWGGQGGAGTVFRLTIVPEFQALTLMTNHTLGLTWSTEAGGTYQLQYKTDLHSNNWINLGSATTATGTSLNTTGSVTNDQQRCYRLVLSP